jgi:hypothetical protein
MACSRGSPDRPGLLPRSCGNDLLSLSPNYPGDPQQRQRGCCIQGHSDRYFGCAAPLCARQFRDQLPLLRTGVQRGGVLEETVINEWLAQSAVKNVTKARFTSRMSMNRFVLLTEECPSKDR